MPKKEAEEKKKKEKSVPEIDVMEADILTQQEKKRSRSVTSSSRIRKPKTEGKSAEKPEEKSAEPENVEKTEENTLEELEGSQDEKTIEKLKAEKKDEKTADEKRAELDASYKEFPGELAGMYEKHKDNLEKVMEEFIHSTGLMTHNSREYESLMTSLSALQNRMKRDGDVNAGTIKETKSEVKAIRKEYLDVVRKLNAYLEHAQKDYTASGVRLARIQACRSLSKELAGIQKDIDPMIRKTNQYIKGNNKIISDETVRIAGELRTVMKEEAGLAATAANRQEAAGKIADMMDEVERTGKQVAEGKEWNPSYVPELVYGMLAYQLAGKPNFSSVKYEELVSALKKDKRAGKIVSEASSSVKNLNRFLNDRGAYSASFVEYSLVEQLRPEEKKGNQILDLNEPAETLEKLKGEIKRVQEAFREKPEAKKEYSPNEADFLAEAASIVDASDTALNNRKSTEKAELDKEADVLPYLVGRNFLLMEKNLKDDEKKMTKILASVGSKKFVEQLKKNPEVAATMEKMKNGPAECISALEHNGKSVVDLAINESKKRNLKQKAAMRNLCRQICKCLFDKCRENPSAGIAADKIISLEDTLKGKTDAELEKIMKTGKTSQTMLKNVVKEYSPVLPEAYQERLLQNKESLVPLFEELEQVAKLSREDLEREYGKTNIKKVVLKSERSAGDKEKKNEPLKEGMVKE